MPHVPALLRGIAILRFFESRPAASLEEIATATAYPKASVLRLCETLLHLGLLARDPSTKRFRPLAALVPIDGRGASVAARLREAVTSLAREARHTVEWHLPAPGGYAIAERAEPEGVAVHVVARLGFVRSWEGEQEAVITVARAHAPHSPPPGTDMWIWDAQGNRSPLADDRQAEHLRTARERGWHADPHFNSNGVRRIAAPVMQGGTLAGVLALAMSYAPGGKAHARRAEMLLLQTAQRLSTT